MRVTIEVDETRHDLAGRVHKLEEELKRMAKEMDDLKAAQAKLDAAALQLADYLRGLATQIQNGISPADVEAVAADINQRADDIAALIAPPAPPAPPSTDGGAPVTE